MLWSGCSLQPLQSIFFADSRRVEARYEKAFLANDHNQVAMLSYGKIEVIPATGSISGVVIGAPHGTFDAYTSALVRRFCADTSLAGVIATGFTPTETGDGWRINVNRPTERHVIHELAELETDRARRAYNMFKNSVLRAGRGELKLYIDIHQNNGSRIEVASLGISKQEAKLIKETYYALRNQALVGRSSMAAVDLAIEPLDELEVGAWPAKDAGILKLAKKSLHFELPVDGMMGSEEHRRIYSVVLTHLLQSLAGPLAKSAPPTSTPTF